jgi:hypothetical protein
MFASSKDRRLRHGGRIWLGAYLVGLIVALAIGATGIYIALIGLLVTTAVTLPLEAWVRYRNEPSVSDEPSRYPTGYH